MAEQTRQSDLLAQRVDLSRLAEELRADLREVERALAGLDHELAHLRPRREADSSRSGRTEQEDRGATIEAELEIDGGRSM